MRRDTLTWVSEFVLMGLSSDRQIQAGLFVLFGSVYLLTLLGNGLIILLIGLDARLHLPMYFFLCNLAVVDIGCTSSGVPQLLVHFLLEKKTISFTRCATQLFFSLALGGTEFMLLAAMAYDRYMAVCDPLHYVAAMGLRRCVALAAVSWLVGLANSAVETAVTMRLPTCGHYVVNHVSCETLALVRLACVDVTLNQLVIVASRGRRKAFGTCASHLTVVSLSYGMALVTHMQPSSTDLTEQDKMVVLFYVGVTPMLNPLIYSLRNKEMKAALSRVLMRSSEAKL
uniref:Olfactory receptor n=1 Tax=Equus asinus TaxID=9793 RepID=A0A8C4PL47_EQUAS